MSEISSTSRQSKTFSVQDTDCQSADRRQKLASKYKEKVFSFIDKCSRNPIVAQDEYWDRYRQERQNDLETISKSLNLRKGGLLDLSTISSTINRKSSITLTKDREVNFQCSPFIDASPSSKDQKEAFYSQLRPRAKEQEVVGPLKLKIHSSLERVYDKLKERSRLDGGLTEAKTETCGGLYSEKPSSILTSKLARYTTVDPTESRNTAVNNKQSDLIDYMRKRTHTHQLIKLNKTNATKQSPRDSGNINIDVLRPLEVQQQSLFLKKKIFPELHGEKRYFKAAQTLLLSDQPQNSPCSYVKGHDEMRFEDKFGKISKNPLIKLLPPGSIDFAEKRLLRNSQLYMSMQVRKQPRDEFEDAGLCEPLEEEPYQGEAPKKQKVKLNQLAREMLIHCNVIRRKRQELQEDRYKALKDELQRKSLISLK